MRNKITEELYQNICNRVIGGESIWKACRSECVSQKDFHEMKLQKITLARDPDIIEMIERREEISQDI